MDLFQVALWGGIVMVAYFGYKHLFPVQWDRESAITVDRKNMRYYAASLVENKPFHGSAYFSGLEVTLPKSLPHIFLDAHKNDHSYNSQLLIASEEMTLLEGDFNNYFQVFVKRPYRSLALSILTPDTMRALLDSAYDFDVEILENKLRIIAAKGLRKNETQQQELLKIAEILCMHIDYRMRSWTESVEDVQASKLRVIESGIIKIGGKALPKAMFGVGILLLVLAIPFWIGGVFYTQTNPTSGIILICAGFGFFPITHFIVRMIVKNQ